MGFEDKSHTEKTKGLVMRMVHENHIVVLAAVLTLPAQASDLLRSQEAKLQSPPPQPLLVAVGLHIAADWSQNALLVLIELMWTPEVMFMDSADQGPIASGVTR